MKQFLNKYWSIIVIGLLFLFSGYLYLKLAIVLPVKLIQCEPKPYTNCWISARFGDLNDCKKAIISLDKYYAYSCAQYVVGEF